MPGMYLIKIKNEKLISLYGHTLFGKVNVVSSNSSCLRCSLAEPTCRISAAKAVVAISVVRSTGREYGT